MAILYYKDPSDGLFYPILGSPEAGGGVTDHGALSGLADDDHPQYLTQARGDARYLLDAEVAALIAAHGAELDPHTGYLKPAEVVAGTNITVDTVSTPGSVIINSTASGGTGSEPGIIEFDDPAYADVDDDAILDNIMAYASTQTYKPTIRLRAGLTTFEASHTPYTGFKLIGAGGPAAVEQIRTGQPYASRVNVRLTGTAGTRFLFDLASGQTHGVFIQGISFEGNSVSSFIGSTSSGVLWTSTLRDLAFSAFYSVLGSRTHKLLNTSIYCDGYWNINNAYDTSVVVGGSDSIFWVGSQFLIDSPTTLNGNILYHMWFDYQEKTVVGGAFCTAEQEPAALRVTGSNSGGTDLVFHGMRFEGRNSGQPSYGSVIRIEGGKPTFDHCWISYGYAAPGSSGRSGELGVITVLGGEALFENCTYSRATGLDADDPWIGASGASTKVIVRNARTADDGGVWSGSVPLVSLASGATLDHDYSVRNGADNNLTGDRWMMWTGTQAQYDALGTYDARRLYVVTS